MTPAARIPRLSSPVRDATGATVGIPVEVKSGLTSEALKFDEPGKVISVFVKTPAQDPREEYTSTYQLDIVRDQPQHR